jgi:acetylglutamate kinase
VGEVTKINPEILDPLISKGYIPIISSIGSTMDGISHNINADFVAGEIAAAINAEKLILLTDTQGILKEKDHKNSLVEKTNLKEARDFIDKKIVTEGMIPKTECCIRALAQGVKAAHIIDGRIEHSLLLEIFTNSGIGTMIVA